jgi:ubiquinone/menaquinone biosynthesis C-methylase UbiE
MGEFEKRLKGFYEFLWPFLTASEQEIAWLDEDTGGRNNRDFLLDIPERYSIGPNSVVLDLGSGKGRPAGRLAKRYGCRVIAFDIFEPTMRLAREQIEKDEVANLVSLVQGSMVALPFRTGSLDFIWCRDAFNHVSNLRWVAAECARVLRAGGHMMNYSALATPWLEPGEAPRLTEPMAISPESLSKASMTVAFESAGLRIVEHDITDRIESPFYEILDDNGPEYIMRLARLLRREKQTVERVGADDYQRLIAYYLWNVYFLIGKMTYGVWVVERRP